MFKLAPFLFYITKRISALYRQIAKSPNRQIVKSSNRQIAKSPNLPIIFCLLFSPSLFADKLDSLLQIHDTSTIVYYYHLTDNLATGNFQTVASNRVTGFQRYNPLDQQERFEAQQKLIEKGDKEAMMPDWEFVEMLEYGMPPAFGFGTGDRLFAFFVDKPLREIQIFPLLRPRKSDKI